MAGSKSHFLNIRNNDPDPNRNPTTTKTAIFAVGILDADSSAHFIPSIWISTGDPCILRGVFSCSPHNYPAITGQNQVPTGSPSGVTTTID